MKNSTNIRKLYELNELAATFRKEQEERITLINTIVEIIKHLNNHRLIEVLNFIKVLDRAQKMEFKAELENSELTDYGKAKLEQLKKELGESQ
ncbi:MAG: hypothetical protein J6Y02_24960 [Pseudobutyrivibrio sp.]|nr:hypothetical protein [Pseudobutyrivibrio sp.]